MHLRLFDDDEDAADELAALPLCCLLGPWKNAGKRGPPKLFCWFVENDSECDDDWELDPPLLNGGPWWCGGGGGGGGRGNKGWNGGGWADLLLPG